MPLCLAEHHKDTHNIAVHSSVVTQTAAGNTQSKYGKLYNAGFHIYTADRADCGIL
jgi:hypothetical protein